MELLGEKVEKPSDMLQTKYLPITFSLCAMLLSLVLSVYLANITRPLEIRSRGQAPSHTVSIDAPKDGNIVPAASISVLGKTSAAAIVVVEIGESIDIVEANPAGFFSATITPSEGPATISVTSFDQDGTEAVNSIDVVSAKQSR